MITGGDEVCILPPTTLSEKGVGIPTLVHYPQKKSAKSWKFNAEWVRVIPSVVPLTGEKTDETGSLTTANYVYNLSFWVSLSLSLSLPEHEG